jgi:hypothetical protein
MTKDEALKMAHTTFMQINERFPRRDNGDGYFDKEITACKESLEFPTNMVTVPLDKLEDMQRRLKTTQEPVAWMNDIAFSMDKDELTADKFGDIIPLYTHPPKEWERLSDKELFNLSQQCDLNHILGLIDYGRAVEAKLREKNEK